MEKRTDKNTYTVLFAVGMVLVVGAILAYLASTFRPIIQENERLEKQQNILYTMGVNNNTDGAANFVSTEQAPKLFEKYITKQLVIENGQVKEDKEAYLIDVKKEQTRAKEGKTRRLPLFVGEKDGKTFYIAPIRGKGLWDAIWGYVAMDKDMVVQGVYFDHKGETPGLGANIKQRYFMDDFYGERLLTEAGVFKGITVSKTNADPTNEDKNDYEVDAIAGATITGDGVSAMIKKDLRLYVPYFKQLKNKG
ncbi:Na+-transporting NADH:ubiquinone oxidoreductase subunit C [Kordia periserrulae]|uniref:Na(+)-translocating NADH-quinone reductase subunit C n=1 Tax=Kordia periserrulae TaxID=701523 RepID=A0A2T6C5H4_9FLAO|nr:Na(+)-translocating NADH-quinone reductase subunit C [Kordia periserrulae]PTX63546.1 Na+-transporting NADH:ubiquinone oxidoreductase subunit C [Kordia periserrulae]